MWVNNFTEFCECIMFRSRRASHSMRYSLPPPRRLCDCCCMSVILSLSSIAANVISRFSSSLGHVKQRILGDLLASPADFYDTDTTDADKIMNPQRFDSDPSDIRIWIRIQIRIPDHFWLRLDALAEVCALWAQSTLYWLYYVTRFKDKLAYWTLQFSVQ